MRLLGEVGAETVTFARSLELDFFGSVDGVSSARCPRPVCLKCLLPLDAVLEHGIVIHYFFVHGGLLLVITEWVVGCELGRR